MTTVVLNIAKQDKQYQPQYDRTSGVYSFAKFKIS